ncbi:blood group Rh(D) polypeptide isoform X1 [Rattus norvegicus]|uniref:blood group Rh(D) polypeptide isoform 2 n=1 Tax=Rattus norvegicus TaxID=10116 RepID=UPI0003D0A326|nr:blood group Rh(D) polypeptide isoform X1 [Rattus norvegicus]|eukprot:XP_006239330.1 PREDICTED: blood group Rh(D) polypeptide isoform X1 [Rattus norvegicus]
MGSKYPRSLRCCLPLWAFGLQVTFILLFYFLIGQDPIQADHKFMAIYQVIQDLTLVAALGFGFLSSSFRRHGWSSVAFSFFMLALGVQGTILLDYFLNWVLDWNMIKNPFSPFLSIQRATISTLPLLISAGAVLGKVNLVQLAVMVLVEAMTFGAIRVADKKVFRIEDHIIMMYGHVFGAYFGLTVAWWLSKSLPRRRHENAQTEKVQMTTSSSLFAMLGTLFLWIFWPSINSALLEGTKKKNAVFNTYYALAVSTVTATSMSALSHPKGKINMVCLSDLLLNPSGIHYTFGLPGLLGALTYYCLHIIAESRPSNLWIVTQTITDVGALSFAMAMGMVTGLLTGCLLSVKVWRAPHAVKYFDDQAFWEFPHLAVEF